MTEIQKSRRSRGLKSMSVAVAASASVVGLVLGTGTASAAVDSSNTVVDRDGNTITVTLSDTFIQGVPSLDGNPLTREWFANGKASWDVTGPSADDFEGDVKIGYQIGYPLSIGGTVSIEWASPTLGLDIGSGNESTGEIKLIDPKDDGDGNTIPGGPGGGPVLNPPSVSLGGVGTSTSGLGFHADLIPQAKGAIALENGPGIVQSESAALPINDGVTGSGSEGVGNSGSIQVANLHGTATGILGNVSVRPYVAVTSAQGDVAVTYGVPVRFN
ncbi:MspA family porin [Rhodococcus ruber]|uniref:MspA family porin n=1 Tax=Rhodococcus ruber TaxID=1830 RepID=A0ABT4MF44_9NOCA|nr:MspA family porin [Rhodococcus ruber]MCZ4519591.1 MspA family porin [Rhodococcus ruber]